MDCDHRPCNFTKKELCLSPFSGPGKRNSKASLLKTRKASKDQKEKFACALQNECSEKSKMLKKNNYVRVLPQ